MPGRNPLASTAWAPLAQARFRRLWLAFLAVQVLVWMQSVAAVEVLDGLGASAAELALVQTATALPTFLLALLAGALADIVDRRRLLLVMQVWTLAVAVGLVVLAASEAFTTPLVLMLTVAFSAGVALTTPSYQSLTPDLVERGQLAGAVSLNGVSVNLGRAVGPALAAVVIAVAGVVALFAVEAAVVVLTAVLVAGLRPPARVGNLPPERLGAAIVTGVRYVRYAPPLRTVLVRAALFVLPASALWALLPVVAHRELHVGSTGFGVLLGCLGAGAVAGATLLPRLRGTLGLDRLIAAGSVVTALVLVLMALVDVAVIVGVGLVLCGVAWIAVLSSLNTAAQLAAPAWVRARALGTYQLVFQGGLAAGSAVWGLVVAAADVGTALVAAAAFVALSPLAMLRWRLSGLDELDLRPGVAWPEPHLHVDPAHLSGPVMVRLTYDIPPDAAEPFLEAIAALGTLRRRDGATWWGVFEDLEREGRFHEHFSVPSWEEHLRQHERSTIADEPVRGRVAGLTVDGVMPAAVHAAAPRRQLGG